MKKAFTLIELLIVMAILGTLSTFVIINFTGAQKRANDTRRKAEIRQYQTALEIYANSKNSLYPIEVSVMNAINLCNVGSPPPLDGISCTSDPKASVTWKDYQYLSTATGTDYIMWAKMEQPMDSAVDEYFVVCSTGEAGIFELNVPTSQSDCSSLK